MSVSLIHRIVQPAIFRHLFQTNWRVYGYEVWYEALKHCRTPLFLIAACLFPWLFYWFFGVLLSADSPSLKIYLLAGYATFGSIAPALFNFGIAVATERQQGLLTLKQVIPMPVSAYFFAKFIVCILFSSIILIGMSGIAIFMAQIELNSRQWLLLYISLIFGMLPFCMIGLAVGVWIKAPAAAAVLNLIYLPMSLLSGLWVPLQQLPDTVQQLAWLLPAYHLAQLALSVVGYAPNQAIWLHLSVLLITAIIAATLAYIGFLHMSDE